MSIRPALPIVLLLCAATVTGATELEAPSTAVVANGFPVTFAALDGSGGTFGHTNVGVRIEQGGQPFIATDSVHEHDGRYSFWTTPLGTDDMEILLVTANGDFDQTIRVHGQRSDAYGWSGGHASDGTSIDWHSSSHPHALVDVMAADGTLLASVRQYDTGSTTDPQAYVFVDQEDWTADLWLVEDPEDAEGDPSWFYTADPDRPFSGSDFPLNATEDPPALPDPDSFLADAPLECDGLVWDPTGITDDGRPSFQQASHVRVAWPDNGKPGLHYAITPVGTQLEPYPEPMLVFSVADDDGLASFLPPTVGDLVLHATWGEDRSTGCQAPFQVTPTPAGHGTLRVDVTETDGGVDLAFHAEHDDATLGHYEYDVRIARTIAGSSSGSEGAPSFDLGRPVDLLWAGKLHAHSGPATMQLDNLEPGTYEVRVHASPQDTEAPGVTPIEPVTFQLAGADDEGAQDTPMPIGLLALLAALVLVRRKE